MNLIVIGRDAELTGYALAGVQTRACDSAADANRTVDDVARPGSGFGLVLVSPWVARHATRAIDAARRRKGPPVVAVIPE